MLSVIGSVLTLAQYKTQILRCRLCQKSFSVVDAIELRFFSSTQICRECYLEGMLKPYSHWCFGKPSLLKQSKTESFGYNALTKECSLFCPDREVCRLFISGQGYRVDSLHQEEIVGS